MKKILFVLFATTFLFLGCSKDDDNSEPSLSGTVWEGINEDMKAKLTFSQLECTLVLSSTIVPSVSQSAGYAYEYVHPTITMTPKESGKAVMEGTLTNNQIILINTSTQKMVCKLTKR